MTRNAFSEAGYLVFLSLLVCLLLASCLPGFKNPIPPPLELKADPQILGTWVSATSEGSKQQLSIFERSSGWIDVVFIYQIDSRLSTDGISVLILEGYSTSIDEQQFLCLRGRAKDHTHDGKETVEQGFWIFSYETPKKDGLIVMPFVIPRIEELIKKGKLKGQITPADLLHGRPFDTVVVTSSSAELVEALTKEGIGAFIEQDPNNVFHDTNRLVFSRIAE
jgi:hypothetical protein